MGGQDRAMVTYTTLDGRVLDLTGTTDDERAYFDRAVQAYRAGMSWHDYTDLAEGSGSLLVGAAGGTVTQAVWDNPVFQAVFDMEMRLGIAQGEVGVDPGTDPERDPLADEWITAPEAARRKGVSLSGVHQAIARGDVIARQAQSGTGRLLVSANSLARWTPSAARQAAGKRRAAVAS
jgi:hypothetical protein